MKKIFSASLLSLILTPISFAQTSPSTCVGKYSMLSIIDRPSVGYSPCTVPTNNLYIESGYDYINTISSGYLYSLPQTEMRFGIINNTEIDFFPPNYYELSSPSAKGFGSTSLGLKHIFYFDSHQIITVQGYITPPSGNQYFGSAQTSFLLNGIYSYNFDSGFNIVGTLGVAANAPPAVLPTKTYYTFNPIIDLGLPITKTIGGYLEVYSQSKTAINRGWGVSVDGGLIFLVKKNLTFDISAGQRIIGYLDQTTHYFGAGLVLSLGL